jgi:hypothetical protein
MTHRYDRVDICRLNAHLEGVRCAGDRFAVLCSCLANVLNMRCRYGDEVMRELESFRIPPLRPRDAQLEIHFSRFSLLPDQHS